MRGFVGFPGKSYNSRRHDDSSVAKPAEFLMSQAASFLTFPSEWRQSVQTNVSARHGHLKQEDQAIIVEKVEKVRRLFDRINAIEVTVDLEHLDKPTVEINVSAEHVHDFVATAQSSSILASLDLCIGKVEQQIRKHKEKVTEHKAIGIKHAGGDEV
jgi:putative sigma-54 modulation protein